MQDKDFDLFHVTGKEEHQFVPDALSRLCTNHVPPPPTLAERRIVALRPVIHARLSKVHNSTVGHWGLDICKRRLSEAHQRQGERDITDCMISEFTRQCPACQVMSRVRLQIKAHRFTCASYNPFEVLHLDHIGPLTKDAHGNEYILVIIDAFSRWVELFPTKSTTAAETASMLPNHVGRFGSPEVIHTDQGPAFHNELITELVRLCGIEQSFATAYSSEENGIVERANQEVLRHLRALLFDSRVHDKWSFEQLPLVQRIMNTVEKTSTGVTPAELILNHSTIRSFFRNKIIVPSLYNLYINLLMVCCNLRYRSRNGATLTASAVKDGETIGVIPFMANSLSILKSCNVTSFIFVPFCPNIE